MNETLAILEKVNAFYSASFDQLLIIVFGAIGLVGVIIPVLITYYQSRQFNIEKKALESYIDAMKSDLISSVNIEIASELEKEKTILNKAIEDNKEELNKSLENSKKELNRQIKKSRGGALLIQANYLIDKSDFKRATQSCLPAITSFIGANDEHNLQRAMSTMTDVLLPNLNKGILKEIPKISENIEHICDGLLKLNENGRYNDSITKLKFELKTALENDAV